MDDCNVAAALAAGEKIADARSRLHEHGGVPVAVLPDDMKVVVLEKLIAVQDERADAPRRLRGLAVHQELGSFIAHVNRFKDADSVIYADTEKVKLTAVLNYHRGTLIAIDGEPEARAAEPRWSDHRSVYACPLSDQWNLWLAHHEKWMPQEVFGQFIEDNLTDLGNPTKHSLDREMPDPTRVLEVARTLVVNAKCSFKREINPSTGEGVLLWAKENEARGSTKVPKAFLLGIPVFEGGELYRIEARLRYDVREGAARFCFSLYQPQTILRDAFAKVREEAQKSTRLVMFAGSPE